jgi:AAA domain
MPTGRLPTEHLAWTRRGVARGVLQDRDFKHFLWRDRKHPGSRIATAIKPTLGPAENALPIGRGGRIGPLPRALRYALMAREELEQEVEAFRRAVAPDQYSPRDFLPLEHIEESLGSLEGPIQALQSWVDGRRQDRDLARALTEEPRILEVIRLLVVAPGGVGLRDGRELPADNELKDPSAVAEVVVELGLRELLPKAVDVLSLCRIASIANDARRRGYRRRDGLQQRLESVLRKAVNAVEERTTVRLEELSTESQPRLARGRGLRVLGTEGRPLAAIANVFQDSTGGRQQRDLSATYPRLQEELDPIPMSLIVLADGRGVADAPSRILLTLFESVAACMTMGQAEAGTLAAALETAVKTNGARNTTRSSLNNLIRLGLGSDGAIAARDLPVPPETARLALSAYAADNDNLNLKLEVDGSRLSWGNPDRVSAAHRLQKDFDGEAAMKVLAQALPLRNVQSLDAGPDVFAVEGAPRTDAVLPERLVIGWVGREWDEKEVESLARATREHVPGSRLAILLVPEPPAPESDVMTRSFQRNLVTTVVPVDVDRLSTIVGSTSPRDALVDLILRTADLTKANPFSTRGVTRPEMFYGRSSEEADLLATLATNSAALVGGRRIGKTSLLQHSAELLRNEGWSPYVADLQEAGDWNSFAAHVSNRWQVTLPKTFAPNHLETLVSQLAEQADGPIVLLLDEVDYLLKWDQSHGKRFPPEAFFRACRALSQEKAAQFVFSGERTISERLWDPASPHWNFCQPLLVKQLTRSDSDELLAGPLKSLGVTFEDSEACMDLQWQFTQGHPQIVQFIGDKLVGQLNDRPSADRSTLNLESVHRVVDDDEFRQHYLTTYWGQATEFEKLVIGLLALGNTSITSLRSGLSERGIQVSGEKVAAAIRMLDLYGIIDGMHDEIAFRATFMPEALDLLGGPEQFATDQLESLNLA